jgi:DNA-nicking Smr family endonuclease
MARAPFEILRNEPERLEGIAPGIDRAHLRRLRRGEVEVDDEVDLHGLTHAEAGRAVREAIADALACGDRCLCLIHGRGVHSPGGDGVLRSGLLGWLSEEAHAPHVMAFASGLRERGGATYVLLRRRR